MNPVVVYGKFRSTQQNVHTMNKLTVTTFTVLIYNTYTYVVITFTLSKQRN